MLACDVLLTVSSSSAAILRLRTVALQCMRVGVVVCVVHDSDDTHICHVRDVTYVRKCTGLSPLNRTASDGKLGEGLEIRLAPVYVRIHT